jgi:TonB-linked SusC/RagA family outer membrane protein
MNSCLFYIRGLIQRARHFLQKKYVGSVCAGLILLLFSSSLNAQNAIIRGKIADSNDEPLPRVTVIANTSKNTVLTDSNGYYSISVTNADRSLTFSYVGMKTVTQRLTGQLTYDVRLVPDVSEMGDVIVIGYGTVKKSDLTGSVTVIKAKDLNPGANASVEQALAGRAAGVQIYQKSGEPGSAMSVKIRGISSITGGNNPLYVIDGLPVNSLSPVSATGDQFSGSANPRNPLNSLNPLDIESIEILKDASATAIYGSRGSNGVILITTKRGAQGALRVGYNGYYGYQNVAKYLDMMTGDEYKRVLNQIIDAGGGVLSSRVTNDVVNVDWQKEISQQASIQSHDLTFSGGKDNTKFYASLSYFKQNGVIINSGTERYSANFNLENSIPKKYAFGISFNTSYIKDKYNSSGLGVNENGSALYDAINYDPTYPVYDSNGNYYRSPFMTNLDQPVLLVKDSYANSDGFRTFGNAYSEYFFLPSLSARIRVGGDVNISQRNTWVGPSTILGKPFGGVASINTGNANYYMGEGTLNYNNDFGKDHSVTGLLGFTYDHFGSNSFGGSGKGYALPDLTYNAIGSGNPTLNTIGSGRASTKIISYLARVKYSYKDRYLLTASIRADGSSRFGPNNRYAYFPSAAFAWKMQEENFMKSVRFVDELKPRVSYGTVGNQNIANYIYISSFASGPNAIFGNALTTSLSPSRVSNPDLRWEGARQMDVGFDFSLFSHRLSGIIDYYVRRTDNLLLNLPQPLSTGFSIKTENIGDMKNSGFELTLNGRAIESKDFTWTITGNFSTNQNEVLSLGPLNQIFTGGAGFLSNVSIIKPGESLGSYYGYKVLGVWQTGDDFSNAPPGVQPGDLKFLDLDKNKTINANDRVILGKSQPDFTYGFTTSFRFKMLTLDAFFEGQQGASILNNTMVDTYFPIDFRRNKLTKPYLNRWTPANPTNEYPSFVHPTSQGQQTINSRTIEDASYFRMQSLRLAYTFNLNNNRAIRNLQVYVTGQNLFTISKYSGIDPAINAIADDIVKIDYNTYPLARTFIFGLNVQF